MFQGFNSSSEEGNQFLDMTTVHLLRMRLGMDPCSGDEMDHALEACRTHACHLGGNSEDFGGGPIGHWALPALFILKSTLR